MSETLSVGMLPFLLSPFTSIRLYLLSNLHTHFYTIYVGSSCIISSFSQSFLQVCAIRRRYGVPLPDQVNHTFGCKTNLFAPPPPRLTWRGPRPIPHGPCLHLFVAPLTIHNCSRWNICGEQAALGYFVGRGFVPTATCSRPLAYSHAAPKPFEPPT